MGYRHYFKSVNNSDMEKIRKCCNEEELIEVEKSLSIECDDDYFNMTHLGRNLFEFGKYYENAESIVNKGKPLFCNEELQERYSDYYPIIGGKELILDAIEWQKNHIIKIYEDLLNGNTDEIDKILHYKGMTDEEIKLKRFENHLKDHLMWWKPEYGSFTAINLDLGKDELCDSWLYEHTIFDLVRIYKSFDESKETILFIGW